MDKTIQIFISLKELEMTNKENVSKRLKLVHTETYPASTMYESNKVLNGFLYGAFLGSLHGPQPVFADVFFF